MKGNYIQVGLISGIFLLFSFGLGALWSSFFLLSISGMAILFAISFYYLFRTINFSSLDEENMGKSEVDVVTVDSSFKKSLDEVEQVLKSISRGDLSYKIKSSVEENSILHSCDEMLNRLRNLISKIMRLSVILSSASSKWAEATRELNRISDEHAVALEELVKGNKAVVNSVAGAKEILKRINQEYVNQGQQIMDIQEEKMKYNLELMKELDGEVVTLDKKTEAISLITETINNLAEETNLLALNASIEAARVGKEGRSFNVIAEEVKDLATDSLSSSKEIMKVVTEVQNGITEVVSSVDNTKKGVEGQQDTVKNVSGLFDNIVETTQEIEKGLKEVDGLTYESFEKTEKLNKGVQKQTGDVNYIAGQANRLTDVSLDLQNELDTFQFIKLAYTKVEETSAAVAKEMLEKELGLGVVLVPLNYAEMYHSIARGILDGMVSSWVPKTHEKYITQFEGDFIDLGANLKGARIGLVVPEYLEINSILDLKDKGSIFPEKKIYAIEATAGITIAADEALEHYGLDDWSVDAVGLDRMIEYLGEAVDREEPIVITGWKPHWMFEKYPIMFLKDPQKSFGAVEEIHTIVCPRLKQDNPQVYEILKKLSFDMGEYTRTMWQIQQGEDPEKLARDYVAENF